MTKRPFSSGLPEERFRKSDRPIEVRPLFEMGSELPQTPEIKQEIDDRKGEAKRVVKRLYAIFEEHREAAIPLKIELGFKDLSIVLEGLREHARGGTKITFSDSRDEIHDYCLNRLFDELAEEPSNILFTTKTGPKTIRYDAMSADFWIECLDVMEATFCSPEE